VGKSPEISQAFEFTSKAPAGELVPADHEHDPTGESLLALGRLSKWAELAQGAYAKNTQRAWRADWRVFLEHCARVDASPLPAAADTVREFLLAMHPLDVPPDGPAPPRRAPATLRRYLATITRIHRAADLEDPCGSEAVKLAMRAIARSAGTRQRQARAFGWSAVEKFLKLECRSLRDVRDRALVAMAYDTLGRTDELVHVDVDHITRDDDGAGTLLIERSKSDQEAEGHDVYLSPATLAYMEAWRAAAKIASGALWRIVRGRHQVLDSRMSSAAIAATIARAALKIGLPAEHGMRVSGHSARVGATQDMLAAGVSPGAVMQAGRWTDARMPARYGARLAAKRGGMAIMAKTQGRAS
jgi:integrase